MNAEKKVLPILWIVLMLVILVCTYAWYSAETATIASINVSTGVPASFVLTVGGVASSDTSFDVDDMGIEVYQGQKGYDENGIPYSDLDEDAPYVVFKNLEYTMRSSKDCIMFVSLTRVEIVLGSYYFPTLEQTITDVIGITDLDESNIDNYYSTSLESIPSGSNPNNFYCVYDTTNSKVTHLILLEEEIFKYFEFDYWDSEIDASDRGYCDFVNIENGIELEYGDRVLEAGKINYVGIHIGFYGYDEQKGDYCQTFKFCDEMYQESTFKFEFYAEAKEKK